MISMEDVRQALAAPDPLSDEEKADIERINKQCIGYAWPQHYIFFRTMLTRFPINSVLMLGVYYGRDIAYFCNAAKRLGRKNFHITGVDKFEDSYCEDWPEDSKDKTWHEAGFNVAPDYDKAKANLKALGFDNAQLIKTTDADYLAQTKEKFDLVYIDTSHDEKTVTRQILSSLRVVNPNGLVTGDDYSDKDTWGVVSAVKACCTDHTVYVNWMWATTPSCINKESAAA